jgi:hypothetical protein
MRKPSRYTTWLIFLLLLTVIITFFLSGCIAQSSFSETITETSEQPQAVPTPTTIPPGLSRENPLNGLENISLKNWEVHVIDIVRGPEAWQRIQDANQFNDPPPDGWSYILIHYQLHRKGQSQVENSLGLHLTGNAHILHYSFNTSVVPPDPILDSYMIGGETSQGWDAYLIRDDESDLMLVLDDLSDYEVPEYFARLEDDAVLTAPTTLDDIEATALGREPDQPLPFGQIATSEEWQIMVQQVQQGDPAWGRVQELNPFNTPPLAGQMYILVRVGIYHIGSDALGTWLNSSDFAVLNHDNESFASAPISGLEPRFYLKLYPGGEYEGWLAFLVNKDDESLVLAFRPAYSDAGNHRYLSLQQSGR